MAETKTKVRLLCDCVHGKCGEVVLVDDDVIAADQHPETGLHQLDPSPAAVAYAEAELARVAAAARKAADGDT